MDALANLSYLDAFIAVSAVIGLLRGWSTGLVDQVLGIIGIIVAIILSAMFAQPVGVMVVTSLDLSPRVTGTVGFAVTFAGVMLAVFFAVRAIKGMMAALALSGIDKVTGALFGGFKALLVVSLLLSFVNMMPLMAGAEEPVFGDEVRESSRLYEPVRSLAPGTWEIVKPVLPGLQEKLFQAVDDLEAGVFEDNTTQTTPTRRIGG